MAINEKSVKDNITKQVQNEIAQQRQAINNSLGYQKKEFDSTINQNKSYLDEQIKKYNTERVVNDDKITALQNRRGGFYSGGLDYQLAENLRNVEGAKSGITRDINSQNQGILDKYNTLAKQAADNISLLERQAPDKIRELVNNELARLRAEAFEREKWEWTKRNAGRPGGNPGGGYPTPTPGPKSKDQSYADWIGQFQKDANIIANIGLPEYEQQLRNNKTMMSQIADYGYNVDAVIDAMYAGATGGAYASKNQYLAGMRQKESQWHKSGGRAVR